MIELAITIRDESQTLTQKHLIHDPITVALMSPDLQPYVNSAIEAFNGDKSDHDIIIKVKMIW